MYSAIVTSYVPKPLKKRLKRIRMVNSDYSESDVVKKALEKFVPEIEKELGIQQPIEDPADAKKVSALMG